MKRYVRAKSRFISSLGMPLFFFLALGLGFSNMTLPGAPENVNYIIFLVPGIIGMTLMTNSMMGGLSVIWDREFGFLKEIMVAPVSRLSIIIGRIAGGVTTAMIQGTIILTISLFAGFTIPSPQNLIIFLTIMLLISITFMGLGLILSSLIKDMQGFGSIMTLIIMPMLFLSGAFYPVTNLPSEIRFLSYINPLTYGIDGLRGIMLNYSIITPLIDITILLIISITLTVIGSYLFEKVESA